MPLGSRDLSHPGFFLDGPPSSRVRNRQCKPKEAPHGGTPCIRAASPHHRKGAAVLQAFKWPESYAVLLQATLPLCLFLLPICCSPPGSPRSIYIIRPAISGIWQSRPWLRAFELEDFLPGRVSPDLLLKFSNAPFSARPLLASPRKTVPLPSTRVPGIAVPCLTVYITPFTIVGFGVCLVLVLVCTLPPANKI